jgi:hypothetical protein
MTAFRSTGVSPVVSCIRDTSSRTRLELIRAERIERPGQCNERFALAIASSTKQRFAGTQSHGRDARDTALHGLAAHATAEVRTNV